MNLSLEKLQVLHLLLLHDGLTESEFNQVVGGSLNKTRIHKFL